MLTIRPKCRNATTPIPQTHTRTHVHTYKYLENVTYVNLYCIGDCLWVGVAAYDIYVLLSANI